MPGPISHTAHRDVFAGTAETAGAMSFDMRKINHEIGVMNHSRHINMTEGVKVNITGIKIATQMATAFKNRTTEIGLCIASMFRMTIVHIMVCNKAISAIGLNKIDEFADKYRRNR